MDRLVAILNSNRNDDEKEYDLNVLLNQQFVESLTDDDYSLVVDQCLKSLTQNSNDFHKKLAEKVILNIRTYRTSEFEYSLQKFITEMLSKESLNNALTLIENFLVVEILEENVSKHLSTKLVEAIRQSDSSLPVLSKIAALLKSHPQCMPPPGQQLKFVLEIINRIASLSVPKNGKDIILFVNDVTAVTCLVERVWLKSTSNLILPSLAMIYTLIVSSSKYFHNNLNFIYSIN